MTEQPCVKVAHNRWLDIYPVLRLLHDLECMRPEAQTEKARTAVENAIEAVGKLLAVVREEA